MSESEMPAPPDLPLTRAATGIARHHPADAAPGCRVLGT
jgi:hypothetical protein